MTNNELLQAGIAAVQAGDLTRAQSLLAEVIKVDPRSESGWLWLGQSQTALDRREYCFRRVLSLNPNNADAKRLLEASRPRSTPPAAESLTEKRPTQTPTPVTPTPTTNVAPALIAAPQSVSSNLLKARVPREAPLVGAEAGGERLLASEPTDQVSPISSPEVPSTSPKPASGLIKILAVLAGLLVGVMLCGTPLAYAIFSGRFDPLIQTALKPAAPTHSAVATQPPPRTMPTFPPTWTPAIGAATPVGTPKPLFSRRLEAAQDDIAQAHTLMQAEQYAEAVTLWNNVLTQAPEYADGYYQRAESYLGLTSNQRFQSEYQEYQTQALADLNEAIRLDSQISDYYFARYEVQYNLGGLEFYRVDQDVWISQALADLRRADELGATGDTAERQPGFMLLELGRCEEGLAEFNQLTATSDKPSAGLNTGLAHGYRCEGRFDEALTHIDTALQIYPSFQRKIDRAIILYNLGQLDDALDQINETIEDSPYYCGCRYFLRALIYYDQGKPDLAQKDIDFGTGQTWDRGGLRSYVLGRLALDAGDQEQGIAFLQEAEASLRREYGPQLLERIQQELAELKAPLLSLEVSVQPTPTLLPILPQPQPPTPTPVPLTEPANAGAIPVPYEGTDALTLNPGEEPVFHFQPPQPLSFTAVEFVDYTLHGGPDGEASGVDLYMWRPSDNQWRFIPLNWGFNNPSDGPDFVTDTGDIYIFLVNTSGQSVEIDNLSVTLTVDLSDGSSTQYGPES